MQVQGSQQQANREQMTDLSRQMRGTNLAPEDKSSAGPWGAAHSYPSSEDEEELSPPASQAPAGRCARKVTHPADRELYIALPQSGNLAEDPTLQLCIVKLLHLNVQLHKFQHSMSGAAYCMDC